MAHYYDKLAAGPFVLLATLLACNLDVVHGHLNMSSQSCQRVASNWTWNLKPHLDQEDATMSVDWAELDESLQEAGCRADGGMWLELWRGRADNWDRGTVDKYRMCDSMDDDIQVPRVVETRSR